MDWTEFLKEFLRQEFLKYIFKNPVFFKSNILVQTADLYSGSSVFWLSSSIIFNYLLYQEPTERNWGKKKDVNSGDHKNSLWVPKKKKIATDFQLCREIQTPGSLPLNRQTNMMSAAVNVASLPWLLNVKNNMDGID